MEDVIRVEEGIAQVPAGIYIGKLERIENFILQAKQGKREADEDMYKFFWSVEVGGKTQTITELCNKHATLKNKLGKIYKALLKKELQIGDEIKLSSLIGFTCNLVIEEELKNGYKNSKITNHVPMTSGTEKSPSISELTDRFDKAKIYPPEV